jgi:hypothetical protein
MTAATAATAAVCLGLFTLQPQGVLHGLDVGRRLQLAATHSHRGRVNLCCPVCVLPSLAADNDLLISLDNVVVGGRGVVLMLIVARNLKK